MPTARLAGPAPPPAVTAPGRPAPARRCGGPFALEDGDSPYRAGNRAAHAQAGMAADFSLRPPQADPRPSRRVPVPAGGRGGV
ncbi:hypothetical protein SGPA1_21895 [Streptomyces misionensis JCM 4497]